MHYFKSKEELDTYLNRILFSDESGLLEENQVWINQKIYCFGNINTRYQLKEKIFEAVSAQVCNCCYQEIQTKIESKNIESLEMLQKQVNLYIRYYIFLSEFNVPAVFISYEQDVVILRFLLVGNYKNLGKEKKLKIRKRQSFGTSQNIRRMTEIGMERD